MGLGWLCWLSDGCENGGCCCRACVRTRVAHVCIALGPLVCRLLLLLLPLPLPLLLLLLLWVLLLIGVISLLLLTMLLLSLLWLVQLLISDKDG